MKNRNEVLQYKVRSENLHKNQTKALLRDETIAAAESVSGWRRFFLFLSLFQFSWGYIIKRRIALKLLH